MHCPYHEYYASQAGSGAGVIYRGAVYQRGHGIGSFLGGIFRTIMPLLKSGAKTVGKELLKSSAGFLGDLSVNRPVRESLKTRISDVGNSLKRKAEQKIEEMVGSGVIKRKQRRTKHQMPINHRRLLVSRRKVSNKRESDIFD